MTAQESIYSTITDFVMAGRQKGWSKGTCDRYRWHLMRLAGWLADCGVSTCDVITARQLRQYGAGIQDTWAPATCRQATIAARSWLQWCFDEGVMAENLRPSMKVPKTPRTVQRTVLAEEVQKLLGVCQRQLFDPEPHGGMSEAGFEAAAIRNGAIIALLYDTLIRAAELCRLTLDNLDMDRRFVVVKIKGGSEGIARFSDITATYLNAWLRTRDTIAKPKSKALFVAVGGLTPGAPLTTEGLRAMLYSLSKRAKITPVTPHSFRRGGAVQAVRNGANTRLVRDFGRWETMEMVEVYTRALEGLDLFDRYAPMTTLRSGKHGVISVEWLEAES